MRAWRNARSRGPVRISEQILRRSKAITRRGPLKDTQDRGSYAHTLKIEPKNAQIRSKTASSTFRDFQKARSSSSGLFRRVLWPFRHSEISRKPSISPRSEIFKKPNRVLQACFAAFCDQKRLLRSPEKKQLHVRGWKSLNFAPKQPLWSREKKQLHVRGWKIVQLRSKAASSIQREKTAACS